LLSVIFLGTIFSANLDLAFPASTDLAVEYLTWDPEKPASGGPFSIHGRIRNAGDTISSDKYTVSLYIDDWWIDGWSTRLVGHQPTISPKIAADRSQVFHFRASDYAIFKQGEHQIKAVVTEPNDQNPTNNELVRTLSIYQGNYSTDFNIINHGMCNGIDKDSLPVDITETYSMDDEAAVAYAYTDIKHADWPAMMSQKASLTFKFYSPNGTLHRERSEGYSVLLARDPNGKEISGFAYQLSITKNVEAYGTKGGPSYDPGYEALGKYPGIWRVEIFNVGHLLFAKRFIIEETSSQISSTSLPPESTLTSEQTSTTYSQDGQVLVGYSILVGVIALAAVGGAVLLKRRKRQPSFSPSLPGRDSAHAESSSTP
jgi:hypothetical protein